MGGARECDHTSQRQSESRLFCGNIGVFCGNIGLFCGNVGLFCTKYFGRRARECDNTSQRQSESRLFCRNIGLFCGKDVGGVPRERDHPSLGQ